MSVSDGPSVRARPYHHGNLRAGALAAARLLVDDGGADAVTVRAVAAAVGVSHTALYRHFTDRRALLDGVGAELLDSIVAAAATSATPRSLLDHYCDAALASPARYRLAFDLATEPRSAPLTAAALVALRDHAAALFAADATTPALVDRVLRTWGTVHGMLDLYWRGMIRARDDDAAARYIVDAALRDEPARRPRRRAAAP